MQCFLSPDFRFCHRLSLPNSDISVGNCRAGSIFLAILTKWDETRRSQGVMEHIHQLRRPLLGFYTNSSVWEVFRMCLLVLGPLLLCPGSVSGMPQTPGGTERHEEEENHSTHSGKRTRSKE